QFRGEWRLQMYGARYFERRAEAKRHDIHRGLVRKPEAKQRARLGGDGQDLHGDLGHHGERPPGSGDRLAEIRAGNVLHHPAPGFERLAPAIDANDAKQMIARGTGLDAATAGEVGGEDAADRGLAGMRAERRPEVDRLEGKLLATLCEDVANVVEGRTGRRRQHELARLVERDADQILAAHHRSRLDEAPDFTLGTAAPHLERDLGMRRFGNEIGHLAYGIRRMEAEAQVPGHW